MGLINLLIKAFILVLDLRDTYDALDTLRLDEIGRIERQVLVRNAQHGSKQSTTRRRVGTAKRKAAIKSALTTVLVWNLFHKVEPLCDRTIAWFVPFYDSFKTLFLIWMLFTRSYGASILVYRFLAPMIRPYEAIIDGVIGLTLALFTWIAAPLAPIIDRCGAFIRIIISSAPQSAPPKMETVISSRMRFSSAPVQADSHTINADAGIPLGKTSKKPPPPSSPPPSIKASPASVPLIPGAVSKLHPSAGTAKSRQVPPKKASHNNLAATRRVLQELPVPRHAFDGAPLQANALVTPSYPASTSTAAPPPPAATSTGNELNLEKPNVKVESVEADLGSPQASVVTTQSTTVGPPPTPPTGLRNYAFIPGQTPQRSDPSQLVSPTPRFPGGFSFSFAAPQASVSASNNPFQAQPRVPLTTQMAPLSLSSQMAAPLNTSGLLGRNTGLTSSIMTRESVPSADDGRIVPPPIGVGSVRKVSSSRSLKGKAAAEVTNTGARASSASNGKKRIRPDEAAEEGQSGEAGLLNSTTSVPRKRVKAASSETSAGKKSAAAATVPTRSKAKPDATSERAAIRVDKAIARSKAAANGGGEQQSTKRTVSSKESVEGVKESSASKDAGKVAKTKATSSSRKEASSAAAKPAAASRKPTAKRSTAASKARSESAEASEASEPPQRLTRSRTKQTLAG